MNKMLASHDYVDLKTLVIEGEISSIQNDILNIQDDISDIQTNVSTLSSDINIISNEIININQDLISLSGDVQDVENSLSLKLNKSNDTSINQSLSAPTILDHISFTPISNITSVPQGQLVYNADEHTLSFGVEDGSLEFGKEVVDCYTNLAGVTLLDGDIVSICGASGNRQAVCLTDITNPTLANACIGMVTRGNGPNQLVRVTKIGKVHNLNTDAYTEGNTIYVSSTNPGKLTNVPPLAPKAFIVVGTVEVKHQNVGVISVDIRISPRLEDLSDVDGIALTTNGQFPTWHNTSGYFDFDKNINDYATTNTLTGNYVPYTGATKDVNLGTHSLSATKAKFTRADNSTLTFFNETTGYAIETAGHIRSVDRIEAIDGDLVLRRSTGTFDNLPEIVSPFTAAILLRDGLFVVPSNITNDPIISLFTEDASTQIDLKYVKTSNEFQITDEQAGGIKTVIKMPLVSNSLQTGSASATSLIVGSVRNPDYVTADLNIDSYKVSDGTNSLVLGYASQINLNLTGEETYAIPQVINSNITNLISGNNYMSDSTLLNLLNLSYNKSPDIQPSLNGFNMAILNRGAASSSTGINLGLNTSLSGSAVDQKGIGISVVAEPGTNVSENIGIGIANVTGATSNYAIKTGKGKVYFEDDVTVNAGNLNITTDPTKVPDLFNGAIPQLGIYKESSSSMQTAVINSFLRPKDYEYPTAAGLGFFVTTSGSEAGSMADALYGIFGVPRVEGPDYIATGEITNAIYGGYFDVQVAKGAGIGSANGMLITNQAMDQSYSGSQIGLNVSITKSASATIDQATGILVGDMPTTTSPADTFSIKTGTGKVSFGDETLAPTAKFGSATSYTQFEANGTMFMAGSATTWEDLNFDPTRSGGPVATRPSDVTINNCFYVEFTNGNNQLCGAVQELPHNYKLSSALYPHAHVFLKSGETSGTTGVTFTIYWELRKSTAVTNGSVTLSATSAQLASTAGGFKLDLYDASFAGSSELGGQLALTLARTGGNAGDVIVTTYGVHYEMDTIGSRTITSK